MNKVQIALFMVYALSMFVAGSTAWQFIKPGVRPNRAWYLGETLLLGSIIIVSEMLLLSLVGLYKAPFLWGVVILNFGCLLLPQGRSGLAFLKGRFPLNPSVIIFLLLLALLMFRNCYFLVDVDSHSTYLYTQKLWLEHGSSIFASPALDIKVFVPQFNSVPYALGLSIYPQETLFAQLVVVFWTVIALLLVFGYVKARLSPAHGLAAAMLTMFNDHMYFSGANTSVIINSAVIAFTFASAVNFWEARRTADPWRLVLALIFWSQIMTNKFQLFYVFVFLFIFGLLIQTRPWTTFKNLFKLNFALPITLALMSGALWLIKNGLATGLPTFPVLAGEFGIMGWDKGMSDTFNAHMAGPLPITLVMKYFSYMCFWPGVNADKVLAWLLILFPFITFLATNKDRHDKETFNETCFWLIMAVVGIAGVCMVSFVDPRHYRYSIALVATAVVFGLHFLLRYGLKAPRFIEVTVILLIAVQGWGVILHQAGPYKKPGFQENWMVLNDKLHMNPHMMYYYYPNNAIVLQEWPQYQSLVQTGAWDMGVGNVTTLSAFLLPTRPQVGLWYTSTVQWSSYGNPALVAKDLRDAGISGLMSVRDGHMSFESAEQYGERTRTFNLRPERLFYNYNFPEELSVTRY